MDKYFRSSLLLHSSSDLYGASKILLTTVKKLKENGEVISVVLSEEGPLAAAIREEGIAVYIIRLGILRRKYFNLAGLANRTSVLKAAYKQLIELANKEKITHIYSNTSAVLIGAFVAKKLKLFHTWHVHEIITQPKWFAALIGKIVDTYSDQVLVVSQAVHSHWEKYIKPEKLQVIHNGIDYSPYLDVQSTLRDQLSLNNDNLLIGMIGRINAWKGQSYFLEIAGQVLQSYPHCHFIMVGDVFPGDEQLEEKMHLQIRSLGLEDKVTVLGFRNDVPDIMAALDLFILPSIQPDPLPTVVLEAMASGRPVIATAHGGACEMIVDNVTGILIPWDNAKESVKKIVPLLSNKALSLQFGIKGRERALNNFSLEAFGNKMAQIFEQAYKEDERY